MKQTVRVYITPDKKSKTTTLFLNPYVPELGEYREEVQEPVGLRLVGSKDKARIKTEEGYQMGWKGSVLR